MPIKEGIEYGVNEALTNLMSKPISTTPDLPLATRINLLKDKDPKRYQENMQRLIQAEKDGNEEARKLLGEIGEDAGRSRRGYEKLATAMTVAPMLPVAGGVAWKTMNNPVVSAGVDIYNNYKNDKTFFTPNNLIAALGILPINTKLGFRAIDPSKLNSNKNRKKVYDLLFDDNYTELPINKKKSLFRPDGTVREFNSRFDHPMDYDDKSLIFTQNPQRNNKGILIELGDRGYDLVNFKKIKSTPTIAISDKDYLDAVYRGDIQEALRMRLQNFINKNLNQKYYRPDRPWFHTTNSEFVKFDHKKTGRNFSKLSRRFMRPAYYFGASPNYEYGDKMKKVLIKSSPTIDVDSRTSFYPYKPNSNSVLSTQAGADLIELAVFDPKLIKSYDAITYDDYGNIIPLSMRDNFKINDIRY